MDFEYAQLLVAPLKELKAKGYNITNHCHKHPCMIKCEVEELKQDISCQQVN